MRKPKIPISEIDEVVIALVKELHLLNGKTKNHTQLSAAEQMELDRRFKNAESGRSAAYSYMRSLAAAMGIQDPNQAVYIAPMKDRNTAAAKFNDSSRNLNDLGRGRIRISTVRQYRELKKILDGLDSTGIVPQVSQNDVHVLTDNDGNKYTDYLEQKRSSGYACAVHHDLAIRLNNEQTGTFEVQVMPWAYEDVYDHSHRLYEMIRILEAVPQGFRKNPKAHDEVIQNLKIANEALFTEEAQRTGFDKVRKGEPQKITPSERREGYDILERIRIKIDESTNPSTSKKLKKRPAWASKYMTAITFAKTSLTNVSDMKHNRNHGPDSQEEHDSLTPT